MSTRNPTHGTKVTDTNAPQIKEGAGSVASDSLAADSDRAGGGFSSNRNGEPLGVSGKSSNFANEDVSGARRLDPASDAEARMAQDDWAEEKKLGAARTPYPDATGGQSKGLAVQNTEGSYSTGGNSSSAETAPSYVNSQFVDRSGPKGDNLTEGGFESDDKNNASFHSEIGSKNDPGRLAEEKFQRLNADVGGDAGFPRQKGTTGTSQYESLSSDAPA